MTMMLGPSKAVLAGEGEVHSEQPEAHTEPEAAEKRPRRQQREEAAAEAAAASAAPAE